MLIPISYLRLTELGALGVRPRIKKPLDHLNFLNLIFKQLYVYNKLYTFKYRINHVYMPMK